jgi:hypothetical protein
LSAEGTSKPWITSSLWRDLVGWDFRHRHDKETLTRVPRRCYRYGG